jgi:hypothetical protein
MSSIVYTWQPMVIGPRFASLTLTIPGNVLPYEPSARPQRAKEQKAILSLLLSSLLLFYPTRLQYRDDFMSRWLDVGATVML